MHRPQVQKCCRLRSFKYSEVAKAQRLDGSIVELDVGNPVFQGDTIETVGSGAVGLVFLDKTTLSLSDGGKMVLDELIYDPATGSGSMAVDMLEGAFSFVSGEIAKTGPDAMQVSTPVATIGIRGTTVAGKAAVEGSENSFTLLETRRRCWSNFVSNDEGQVLAQVESTYVFQLPAPPPPLPLSAAQIQANYGAALNVLPPTPVVALHRKQLPHHKNNNKNNKLKKKLKKKIQKKKLLQRRQCLKKEKDLQKVKRVARQ